MVPNNMGMMPGSNPMDLLQMQQMQQMQQMFQNMNTNQKWDHIFMIYICYLFIRIFEYILRS